MQYPLEEQWFGEGVHRFRLMVPVADEVQRIYNEAKASGEAVAFPYWAKTWPAAIALFHFISKHPEYVKGKQVLELAAGVGLPSMLTAFFAAHVVCSDSDTNAVEAMQRSIRLNGFQNVDACVINWNDIPVDIQPEVILLSDINYEPDVFDELYELLMGYKEKGVAMLLATPQRLMAKPFIERLLPHCMQHTIMEVMGEDVSVLVM